MRNFFRSWICGVSYLFTDDLISFYAFFATILAEVAFLWAKGFENALAFSVLLILCIINVIICSYYKGEYEGSKLERIVARIYVIIFAILFLIGVFVNIIAAVILFTIPFVFTTFCIWIRGFQDTVFVGKHPKIILLISKIIQKPIVWVISQIIVIGLPMFMCIYYMYQTPMSAFLKILFVILMVLFAPFIAYLEDNLATCNIFELAYDITWSEEYERKNREFFEKMQKDPEGTKKELKEELLKYKEDLEEIFEKVEEDKEKHDD